MTAAKIYGDTPEQRERVRRYIARIRPEMNTAHAVANGKADQNHAPTSLDRIVLDTDGLLRILRFLIRVGKRASIS